MCRICGVYQERTGDLASLRAAVQRMATSLAHRGPDDEGVWVALENRRLAIIDLSPAGHQPVADPRGEVVLTYNGESTTFGSYARSLPRQGTRPEGTPTPR